MREAMLIVHFKGLAMGVGTSFAFRFLGIASSRMEKAEGRKFTLNTFVLSKMGHIGLSLLIISGIYLILPYWSNLGEMPLLIAKLALVVILGGLIGAIGSRVKKAKAGNTEAELKKIHPPGMLSMFTGPAILILAVLIFQ